MSSQQHDPNRKENYDSNRPAFLITPPLLSKKPVTKEQIAAEHAFDNFDGAGVASSDYAPSISSSVYTNQDADQPYSHQDSYRLPSLPANSPSKLAFDRPSSINVVTPTTSSFHSSSNQNSPQQYPSSPAPSATVAALASASARTPLKIKSVRMVESSQNPPTPLEAAHNLVSNDPRSLNYQQVPPAEVMRHQDGFPVGSSIRSLAGTSVYDAQSAVQGNIDDDDDEDEEEGNDAYITDNIYQYDTNHDPPLTEQGHNPYKSPISTVHTPPLLNSTTSFDVNGKPVNSTINHVPNEYASTNSDSSSYIHVTHSNANSTGSSFQNVSVSSADDAKQSQNLHSSPTTQESHHYKQIIASENSSEAQLPHIQDDAIPLSSYYYDKNFDGVDIANDPTPYPPQHVLKQYRPDAQPDLHGHEGEDLQSMKPRTTTHPTLNTNRDFIPNQHKIYSNTSSAPHSHSKSISSSYSSASLESAGEEHHAHHNHSSVASIASSAILDSSGGIYKVSEPGSVPGSLNVSGINLVQNDSARNSTDNVSVYSEVSNATVRGVNLPSSNVDGDPNNSQNTQNIVPRAIVQGPTQGAQSGGYEAPLNTNEEGRRMVSRTNELLLKRQASGGPQQLSAATVNIADNFKNDHIAAPVIVDEVTGEPLVFYPASIPVELKLPPLLSKKNQMKVQAMKAKASARQNRPKTFAVPPPPVWTVDPTIVPENLQEQRRSSVGSSSMLLNRRQSLGAMSVMTDATTTIKVKRRRSSAGTLSVFDMNAPDKQNRSSANLDRFGNEITKDKQKGKKHEELPQISITRKSFIEDDDYNEEIDTNDKEENDAEKKDETNEETGKKQQTEEGEPNVIRLGHRKKKSSVSFISGTSSDHNTNVAPESELTVSKIRKSHARKASAVSKMSYIDGDDAWDDGEEEFEEYEGGGQADGEYNEEDIGNDSELIETGHFLNDEIGSDCATLPSDDEYQEEVLASDEEEEDPEKNGAIGNDRSVDDFAFTSFDPNAPITERGLLGGSIAYSSGIFPSVGIQPQTLVEELELRKAERKARVQKVYYDTVTGNAIAADMYGRREPDPDQLVRLQSSGHPLDERHNKSLLELQEIAKMNYSEDLQLRRNVQNAHEIERQMYRYGGVNGSKAVLNQFGLLNGTGNGESELLEEKPNETLKERRARLKKLKKEQEQAQAELAAYNSISMEGEGGLPDDEEEPPGETLAERRARLKKKKKMKRDQAKKVGENGSDGAVKDETQSLLEKNDSLVSGHQVSEQMPLMGNGITA